MGTVDTELLNLKCYYIDAYKIQNIINFKRGRNSPMAGAQGNVLYKLYMEIEYY